MNWRRDINKISFYFIKGGLVLEGSKNRFRIYLEYIYIGSSCRSISSCRYVVSSWTKISSLLERDGESLPSLG
jgi:hypothetical protein